MWTAQLFESFTLFFDRSEKLRINDSVKMKVEWYISSSQYVWEARVHIGCQLLVKS